MKEERGKKEAMAGKIEIINEGVGVDKASPDINATLCCGAGLLALR